MMSTCHGMYSLGGFISTGLATFFFFVNVPSGWQVVFIATVITTVIILNRKHLLIHTDIIHSRSGIKLPSLTVLGISFICMIAFMAEGCVADWSGIYLKDTLHSAKELVSLGYTGFAIAMTIGRFNGDTLINKIGGKKVVIGGSLLSATGFTLVVLAPSVPIAIIGYTLVGCGCFCTVPVLFSAATNIPGLTTVEGFAMVTTGGLIGFLTGPSVIGFISEKINMRIALSLLIVLALTAAIVAWRNKFLENKRPLTTELPHDEQIY
jgi:MFS family permease